MKYFLIAGEASGDQHAARLMEALLRKDTDAVFSFLGGDNMEKTGGSAVVHIREMAFMGFTQILSKLGRIRKNFKTAKQAIQRFNPDVLILVDYAGFNLKMAKWAKNHGFLVYYYIAPKVWAWNTNRVKKLKAFTNQVFSILPFEEAFFQSHHLQCTYVGSPVLEAIETNLVLHSETRRIASGNIAILPGSRKQEIERILPLMLSVVDDFPDYRFIIAGMSAHKELYKDLLPESDRIELRFDDTWEVLNDSAASLVTSGTATLETSLIGIPQIVCYKTNPISFQIARRLIKVRYISLVNLILDAPAVPELIQSECNRDQIKSRLSSILPDGSSRHDQLEINSLLREKLGSFSVSCNLSSLIINSLDR